MDVTHEIEINAPRHLVWSITVGITDWPTWTPTVTQAQPLTHGALRPGSRYRLKQPMQPATVWEVTDMEDGRSFAWEARNALMTMRACHRLRDAGSGTQCELSVSASGIGAIVLWPLLRPAFAYALRTENAGLKAACESRANEEAIG